MPSLPLMIALGLMAAVLTGAAPSPSAPLAVNIGGRVAAEADGGYRFGWPGVYFEARFMGPAVDVRAQSETDFLEVLIDGVSRGVLRRPDGKPVRYAGLGPGAHTIRLQKLTESQRSASRFIGFFPADGATPLPPPHRERQIEIIGDSYSVGYGDASAKRTCTREEIHDSTNTRLAYGPLAAERLGADYRVNAYSGYGVVRNYDGYDPERSLLTIYDRAVPGDPGPADTAHDATWRPQVIVVALGTNDFSTPVHKGERWADAAALSADYRARYLSLLRDLSRRQPQARFVLLAGPSFTREVEAIAAEVNAARPGAARVLPYADLELTGCDWHPSVRDQARLAARLVATVEGFAQWPAT